MLLRTPLQSPKKWSKIVSIPLNSKLHHLAFRPNNGARDNILAVATEAELVVFKICSEVSCIGRLHFGESYFCEIYKTYRTSIWKLFKNSGQHSLYFAEPKNVNKFIICVSWVRVPFLISKDCVHALKLSTFDAVTSFLNFPAFSTRKIVSKFSAATILGNCEIKIQYI